MSQPIVYGLAQSVYTRIVRLVLEEKSIVYDFVEVDVFSDEGIPPYYLKLHPFGRIPCLVDGDFALYETCAITRYIDGAYPGRLLQPNEVVLRARMNQIISSLDSYAYRPMIWDVFVERIVKPLENEISDEEKIERALPLAEICLAELSRQLSEQVFLVGENPSLADLHTAPMLAYFVETPEGSRLVSQQPRLSDWLSRIRKRESFMKTCPDYV